MSIFKDDSGCIRIWVFVVLALLICLSVFAIPVLLFAPIKGREEHLYYDVGSDYMLYERIDHCLFWTDTSYREMEVVCVGGQYFYKDDCGFLFDEFNLVKFDLSEIEGVNVYE